MSLTDDSGALSRRERVDGATVNRRFNKSIKDNGGAGTVYRDAAIAETRELFDCDVNTLYRRTGGNLNDRSTLPVSAQEAFMVNEVFAANELERSVGTYGGETQKEVNQKIVQCVSQTSKQTRKWLPW
ncbi:MAG: hypothetical protein AAGF01_05010 [Cyanobacteria bacterium P01_G01_bin.38]